MQFDTATLHVCNALMNGTYGLMFLGLWAGRREERHFALWGVSLLLSALCVTGMALLERVPGAHPILASIFFGGIAANVTFVWAGMRFFDGRRPFRTSMLAMPLLAFAVNMAGHGLLETDMAVALGMAVLAANVLLVGRYVLTHGEDRDRFGRRACGLSLLAYVPFYGVSILGALSEDFDAVGIVLLTDQVLNNVFVVALFAITLRRSHRALEEQALSDGLTGALNRTGLARRLAERPGDRRRMVLVADLDHFKGINDRFGHSAGDAVLCAFVGLARQVMGPGDLLARSGGEEFVLVLEEDPATALGKAETLRRLVADTPTPMGGFAIPITVSIGMAELAGTRTLADSLEQADRALYRAKETGRNRVAEPEFA